MTKLLHLLIVGCLFISCSKNDCNDGFKNKFSPTWHETYFELLKPNGSSYENEEVKISTLREYVDGELVPYSPNNDEWHSLFEINSQDSIPDVKLFGLGCETCTTNSGLIYASGPNECGYDYFENWNKNKYYLIEFPDQQIDTLLIKDILKPGGVRKFRYFINSAEIDIQVFLHNLYLQIVH